MVGWGGPPLAEGRGGDGRTAHVLLQTQITADSGIQICDYPNSWQPVLACEIQNERGNEAALFQDLNTLAAGLGGSRHGYNSRQPLIDG